MFTDALLFDLDGTMTDSDPMHFEAFVRTAIDYGVKVDHEMFLKYVSGQANAYICRSLFPHVDEAEHPAIADRKEALFRKLIVGKLELFAGLADVFAWAKKRGTGLAVVSNAPRANIVDMLAALKIAHLFDAVVCGLELERGKPDPLSYLTALEILGVPANHAVAFEDAPPGIAAAHGSGVAVVGLTTTQSAAQVLSQGADIAISDYTDPRLMGFIEAALAGQRQTA